MEQIWQPTNSAEKTYTSHVDIYNFGSHIGFLIENNWYCYHLLERHIQEDGSIYERVEKMADDWVPQTVITIETYPVLLGSSELFIPGWKIQWIQRDLHEAQTNQELQEQEKREDQSSRHQIQMRLPRRLILSFLLFL